MSEKNNTTPNTPGNNEKTGSNDSQKGPVLPKYDTDLLKKKGITIGKVLNSGSFSIVCKADMRAKAVAVKIIDLTKTSNDYQNRFLPRELYTMRKLKHPNIIGVYDIYTLQETRIYVFMDLADGGDILDLIKEGPLSEPKAKPIYRGVADALRYIHEQGFAHRDIKCENILLNKEQTIAKIGDFGFSRTCFNHNTGERLLSKTFCGSAAYAAPEILKAKAYNAMIADVWSMGVVLFVIVNNRLPFYDRNHKELVKLQTLKKLQYNTSLSESCKDLISKQLEPDTKQRYTMKQVLEHQWIQ